MEFLYFTLLIILALRGPETIREARLFRDQTYRKPGPGNRPRSHRDYQGRLRDQDQNQDYPESDDRGRWD